MREQVCLVCHGEGYIEHFIVDENGKTKILSIECEECFGRGIVCSNDSEQDDFSNNDMENF